ncbi:conserved hypothetical protein [Thiomonas arsenitoxydans]|uniref:Uncharacterized protein n=1 Tax=Thiomonas arsenitoxydans (strain DSM 22701 / CIP 110005 / 3As) TaxID=426114 RepID=D6CND7_THIA3|nr:hypothetical protein THI_3478 [Thiomonas arsenitoxydans]CQR37113.1 conserved hypothetical protein [Thiomonas arsenitoxydans]CQR38232.1 conserved hypothetical protein [Thiomonas arsenitoxydans]CQR40376.1 conserved hypothetical protein [Thiomonas arsenitoxydans]CQR40442.1 conserved hypothetical protein [Thiomonas arsenitoxydans]
MLFQRATENPRVQLSGELATFRHYFSATCASAVAANRRISQPTDKSVDYANHCGIRIELRIVSASTGSTTSHPGLATVRLSFVL